MRSTMGCRSRSAAYDAFTKGFEVTISREPDDSRVIDTGKGYLGFHRSAITGLHDAGMQPFQSDRSYAVCNGEIYGFEELRSRLSRKYELKSGSDCEIILPMYKEYGTAMFVMLDAKSACVIYGGEREEYIAVRNPIGVRPLHYGYDKQEAIIFASEPKNLVGIAENIMPSPPGHYCKDGKFICYLDISTAVKVCEDDLEKVCRNICKKSASGMEKRLVADAKAGFLLLGGLDPSLVCVIAAKKRKDAIKIFAIGMREDAIDLRYAKQVANHIGSDHTEILMTPDNVTAPLRTVIYILGTFDTTMIRASIGMYLVRKAIHEKADTRALLTGEISNELFGYKYTDFAPDEETFQLESQKRMKELHIYDMLRAGRCISTNSLEAGVPSGDIDFVKYVMPINPKLKTNRYGKGKYLLRHAFGDGDYLPDEILWREKAAFSDAIGHFMVDYLKVHIEEIYTDTEFKDKCKNYDYTQPFTKKSLLYREIFEEYCMGQSKMVVDFWMSNKEWDDCHVNDLSTRVLSNYGDSGTQKKTDMMCVYRNKEMNEWRYMRNIACLESSALERKMLQTLLIMAYMHYSIGGRKAVGLL